MSEPTSLGALLAGVCADSEGGYVVAPGDDWRQGRTLYGGLTTALCAAGARRALQSPPPLRSVQIAFAGPASGRVRVVPTLLRRGRSAAFVGVDAFGEDGLCARATFTYGIARDSDLAHLDAAAPVVAGPDACPEPALTGGPAFLRHVELRHAAGGIPFAGGEPRLTMWVRHRDAGAELDPTLALLAVADVMPPAASPLSRLGRPMSTMTWSLEIVGEPVIPDWYLLHSASERTADGYSAQTMGCWADGDRPLALGRQTVALF